MTGSRSWWALAAAILCFGSSGSARAQTPEASMDEGPSLEFRTNVPWARMKLSGDQTVQGRSPLRIPGPLTGRFWLEAEAPGVELQRGRVSIALNEDGSRVFSYGSAPARQALARSVLFPGHHQLRSRDVPKGVLLAAAGLGGAGFTVWAHDDYRALRDEVESLEAAVIGADSLEAPLLQEQLRDARAGSRHRKERRDLFVKVTAAVWGVGLLDAVLFSPRLVVEEADGSQVRLEMRRKTRGRAMARSLLFPGLGQDYNGDPKKGLLVGVGGVLAGSYLLWRQDDLHRVEADLAAARARLAEVGTVEAASRRDGQLRRLEDAERERNTALWVAAGYWVLSLLDTALTFEEPWGDLETGEGARPDVGLLVDPAKGRLAAALRF